ncbi:hypothetical protein MPSEU_000008800 [Mayamaea pseudoterrestris]|nr:hypothetical protein MPSEU_000008800 [Mayamaea pseudoterrestris]
MRLLLLCAFAFSAASAFVVAPRSNSLGVSSIASSSTSTSSQLSAAKYNQVFVAGGSRGVGRAIIDECLKRGSKVTALVRDPTVATELNAIDGVTAIVGDAFDQKVVENAMDGCDAAITTLGGSTSDDESQRVDYAGNSNVIESAGILGVTRIILVTSIGCGTSKEAAPPSVFEVLKDVLKAKERAENVLIKYYTNSNWTIIRPGGLKSEPATGQAILTENTKAIGSIHREDVASLVVQALESDNATKKILSAFDPSLQSALAEGLGEVEAFSLN